jgi:tRNA pseudouridine38-40 synthase
LTLRKLVRQVEEPGDPSVIYVCGLTVYDGTNYHGFQYQAGVPTIQGELEKALRTFTNTDGRISGSGRTDKGVHARGQVIAARVPWQHSVDALQRAWNVHLPGDVLVRKLQVAPPTFHPRFSALRRTYRYTVYDSMGDHSEPKRAPLTDRFALVIRQQLDVVAMNQAAGFLVGEHNFATFGQPPEGEVTVRQVYIATWEIVATNLPPLIPQPGRQLVFTIQANAFLYQMVRNIVATLLEVGLGHWSAADVQTALQACERRRSAPPIPPCGLVLEWVDYPAELGLVF